MLRQVFPVTAVPAAMIALVELLRAAPEMVGCQVEDGPWIARPDSRAVTCVGWVPDEGEAVTWVAAVADMGGGQAQSFTFQGMTSVLDGDDDLPKARQECDELVEAIRAVVQKNRRLNGAVNSAELTTVDASPAQTNDGAEWYVRWAVNCRVF